MGFLFVFRLMESCLMFSVSVQSSVMDTLRKIPNNYVGIAINIDGKCLEGLEGFLCFDPLYGEALLSQLCSSYPGQRG